MERSSSFDICLKAAAALDSISVARVLATKNSPHKLATSFRVTLSDATALETRFFSHNFFFSAFAVAARDAPISTN